VSGRSNITVCSSWLLGRLGRSSINHRVFYVSIDFVLINLANSNRIDNTKEVQLISLFYLLHRPKNRENFLSKTELRFGLWRFESFSRGLRKLILDLVFRFNPNFGYRNETPASISS
jgi:hypothetical protein